MKLSLLFVSLGIGTFFSGVFPKPHSTEYKMTWTDTFSFEFLIS